MSPEEAWRELKNRRNDRWDLLESLVRSAEDPDDLIADIMNLATVLWVMRKQEEVTQPVHRPFGGG